MEIIAISVTVLISLLLLKLVLSSISKWRSKRSDRSNTSKESFDYDVVIVGSGILGSALAAVLGRDGRKVAVVERNLEMPERFVGELLQPGGIELLRKLGLQDCIKDIDAQNVHGYAIYGRGGIDNVKLPYPMDSDGIGGLTLNNGRLVMTLRQAAMSEENVTYLEGNVIDLESNGDAVTGVVYKPKNDDDEKAIRAKLTVVADGCFSQFRRRLVNTDGEHLSSFIAGLLKNRPEAKSNFVEFFLTDPDPVILYSIDSESTRVIIDLRKKIPTKDLRDYFAEKVCPQLPEPYRTLFLDGMTSVSLRSMPTLSKETATVQRKGALFMGDALNMRHPITAGGMTVAFADIALLRELLADIKDLSDHDRMNKAFRRFFSSRRRHSFVMNSLANIFFEIMAANDDSLKRLQEGYLKFVSLDAKYIKDSVELITALNTRAYSFLKHLICVALYSAYLPFKKNSRSTIFRSIYESISTLGKVCTSLLPLMWPELKSPKYLA